MLLWVQDSSCGKAGMKEEVRKGKTEEPRSPRNSTQRREPLPLRLKRAGAHLGGGPDPRAPGPSHASCFPPLVPPHIFFSTPLPPFPSPRPGTPYPQPWSPSLLFSLATLTHWKVVVVAAPLTLAIAANLRLHLTTTFLDSASVAPCHHPAHRWSRHIFTGA